MQFSFGPARKKSPAHVEKGRDNQFKRSNLVASNCRQRDGQFSCSDSLSDSCLSSILLSLSLSRSAVLLCDNWKWGPGPSTTTAATTTRRNNLLTCSCSCSCSCSLAAFLPRQQFCNLHSITSFGTLLVRCRALLSALLSLSLSLSVSVSAFSFSGHSSALKRVTQLAVQGFCAF